MQQIQKKLSKLQVPTADQIKRICYAISYGMSVNDAAQMVGISPQSIYLFRDIINGKDDDMLIPQDLHNASIASAEINNRIAAYFTAETMPTPEEFATMSPLDVLKRAFPDQDVESLLKILGGAA